MRTWRPGKAESLPLQLLQLPGPPPCAALEGRIGRMALACTPSHQTFTLKLAGPRTRALNCEVLQSIKQTRYQARMTRHLSNFTCTEPGQANCRS